MLVDLARRSFYAGVQPVVTVLRVAERSVLPRYSWQPGLRQLEVSKRSATAAGELGCRSHRLQKS